MSTSAGTSREAHSSAYPPSSPGSTRPPADADGASLATALGWFSMALGAAGLVAPGRVARLIGAPGHVGWVRACGVRELATGIGLLTQDDPRPWLQARVAGDAVDALLLGAAARTPGADRRRLAITAGAVAAVTALDLRAAGRAEPAMPTFREVSLAVRVSRPPDELYRWWRDFSRLPSVMRHLRSVEVLDDRRSRWTVRGPMGSDVSWEAEIIEDRPNEMIGWRSVPGGPVDHFGKVMFTRDARGEETVVRVDLMYRNPGGRLGRGVAALLGATPEHQIREDLRPFKQLMETGEIATTLGQPAARASSIAPTWDRAARLQREPTPGPVPPRTGGAR
jgi:uncharacterized membrane protein